MGKPTSMADWHEVTFKDAIIVSNPECIFDTKSYISNDRQWIWKRTSTCAGADWFPLADHAVQQQTVPQGTQERTVNSMYIWSIAAVKVTSVVEQQQGKSSEILATGQVIAKEQNLALALFGAKHADALEGVSADLLQITIRQGV